MFIVEFGPLPSIFPSPLNITRHYRIGNIKNWSCKFIQLFYFRLASPSCVEGKIPSIIYLNSLFISTLIPPGPPATIFDYFYWAFCIVIFLGFYTLSSVLVPCKPYLCLVVAAVIIYFLFSPVPSRK